MEIKKTFQSVKNFVTTYFDPNFWEAKKIVDQAQAFAYPNDFNRHKEKVGTAQAEKDLIDDEFRFKMQLPKNVGIHVANNGDIERWEDYANRKLPYRASKDFALTKLPNEKWFEIAIGDRLVYSSGNEEMNPDVHGPDHKIHTPEDWINYVREQRELHHDLTICSPALLSLKSLGPKYKKIIELGAEKYFSYWCLNFHPPSYIPQSGKTESGVGWYELLIRQVREYVIFSKLTKHPVIFTEMGNGDGDNVNSPFDIRRSYKIAQLVFGSRLIAVLIYNSGLLEKLNGKEVLRYE